MMNKDLRTVGARIERCERALNQAQQTGDSWAIAQNSKALRLARADYALVANR
jgi:hypothetical protein